MKKLKFKHAYTGCDFREDRETINEDRYFFIEQVNCIKCLGFAANVGYGQKEYYENLLEKALYNEDFQELVNG